MWDALTYRSSCWPSSREEIRAYRRQLVCFWPSIPSRRSAPSHLCISPPPPPLWQAASFWPWQRWDGVAPPLFCSHRLEPDGRHWIHWNSVWLQRTRFKHSFYINLTGCYCVCLGTGFWQKLGSWSSKQLEGLKTGQWQSHWISAKIYLAL